MFFGIISRKSLILLSIILLIVNIKISGLIFNVINLKSIKFYKNSIKKWVVNLKKLFLD